MLRYVKEVTLGQAAPSLGAWTGRAAFLTTCEKAELWLSPLYMLYVCVYYYVIIIIIGLCVTIIITIIMLYSYVLMVLQTPMQGAGVT